MFDSNITVVRSSSTRRRAYDDGGDDFVLPSMSRRTASLSSHVMEDADAIRHSSRRQDAHLLNDITARLGAAPFSRPMDHHRHHHTQRTLRASSLPPPSARRFHHEDLDFPEYRPSVHARPASSRVFVRASSEPREIYSSPRVFPGPSYLRHRYRASSVPRYTSYHEPVFDHFSPYHTPSYAHYSAAHHVPRYSHFLADHVPKYSHYSAHHVPRYSHYSAHHVPEFGRFSAHHVPRYAHVPLYHEPSYVRHSSYHVPRYEHSTWHSRPTYTPYSWYAGAASLSDLYSAPSFRHRMRDDFKRSWYQPTFKHDFGLDDYYGLEDEMPAGRRIYPTRTVVTASHHAHSPSAALARRPPLPSTARVHPRAAKYMVDTVSDYRDPTPYVPAASMNNLRTRAAECRSKMDHQKVLLDRYLPVYMGPDNDVQYEVEAKYGELAARMPNLQAQRRTRNLTERASSVPPYRPSSAGRSSAGASSSSYNLPPRGVSHRPPVSDVRKRCREVLCKTKHDPTYFNY